MKTKSTGAVYKIWFGTALALMLLATGRQSAVAQTNTFPSNGNVGIGTTAPDQKLVVSANSATTLPASNGIIQIFGADGVQPVSNIDGFGAGPVYLVRRANTSGVSPSALLANDLIGVFGAAGYGSTGYQGTRARVGFFASENWTNSANGTYMAFNTTANGVAVPGGTERMRIDNAGNVGIGTTSPGERLQIHGNLKLSSDTITNGVRGLTPTGWGYSANYYRVLMVGASSGNETVSIGYDPSSITNGLFWGDGREVLFRDGASFTTPNVGANTFFYNTVVLKGGNVGIGIPTPGYKLDVQGGQLNASGGLCIAGDCKTAWSQVGSQWTSGTNSISYSAGNVGIGTTPTPTSQYKLDVNGATNVTGNLNATGTITGGNIVAKYQDVAEWVASSEQIPTGTVVVLDSTKSNQVISSTQSYDTRVAGVISEQPGIALGESGTGKVLVATTGRVMVQVDATNGPIHIGDLLVTSDVPGVAMKSEPIKVAGRLMHMPGTLIGKALEPFEKGSGKILVLLSLQ